MMEQTPCPLCGSLKSRSFPIYYVFREKKFEDKRLYFLVYENCMIILALAISDKKAQRETIDKIISELKTYKEIIDKKLMGL